MMMEVEKKIDVITHGEKSVYTIEFCSLWADLEHYVFNLENSGT
jgi:hypothetical protein